MDPLCGHPAALLCLSHSSLRCAIDAVYGYMGEIND